MSCLGSSCRVRRSAVRREPRLSLDEEDGEDSKEKEKQCEGTHRMRRLTGQLSIHMSIYRPA